MFGHLNPEETCLDTHRTGSWVCPTYGLGQLQNKSTCPCYELNPSRQPMGSKYTDFMTQLSLRIILIHNSMFVHLLYHYQYLIANVFQ